MTASKRKVSRVFLCVSVTFSYEPKSKLSEAFQGVLTRMVYLYYKSCLRYTILVGEPSNFILQPKISCCSQKCVNARTDRAGQYSETVSGSKFNLQLLSQKDDMKALDLTSTLSPGKFLQPTA